MDLESIRVPPLTFVYKYRYVFSDMTDSPKTPLENAYVNVDMKMKSFNQENEQKLFIFICDKDTLVLTA